MTASELLVNVCLDSFDACQSYQLCIHFRDSFGGLLWGGELHKANTAADACVGVAQHLARHDGAKLLQQPYTFSVTQEDAQ